MERDCRRPDHSHATELEINAWGHHLDALSDKFDFVAAMAHGTDSTRRIETGSLARLREVRGLENVIADM